MAELVAEAFLSAAFQKLIEKLASPETRSFFQGKKSIDDKLERLKEDLKKANLLLNDAEERQITDQQVKEWLDDLKDIIFKSDDLLEEISKKSRSKQVERESGCSMMVQKKMFAFLPTNTKFDKNVRGEVDNIVNCLHLLLERADTLHLTHIDGAQTIKSSRRSPPPLLEEGCVHGRQDDKAEILKLLLSDENWRSQIGVLPIVGMGGLGKTTLAQLVYDDDRVKNHGFSIKAWVTVSTEFDISKITKLILQQVSPQTPVTEELAVLQKQLKKALKGKKFLFVLDDVWEEKNSNWDSLQSSFTSGDCGSRIIVTTRSQTVASNVRTGEIIYKLQPVSNEDCWKIFVHNAFTWDSVVDSRLQQIGKKIVEKCKGLPLAVRSLGGLLRTERNPEVWESTLRSRVWSKKLLEDILPGLWLSYCRLPSSLKQCFAYCSVFPKDYRIKKEDTIWLWMAEGFLQSDGKDETMEEVGRGYFDELVARSLLQRSSQDESTFVMHDLVHDLAMFVSGEFCFRFDGTMSVEQLTKRTRYLSTDGKASDPMSWKDRFEAKHLRSFIRLHSSYFHHELVQEVLEGGRSLRVLSQAYGAKIPMLNDSFNKLKRLRYLNLGGWGFKERPCSICTLYDLQTLVLSECGDLTRLPKDMGKLIHLRHLDITCGSLQEMPPQMSNLKELQTLTNFVVGEHGNGSSIEELGALRHLAGKLRISRLQNIGNDGDVLKANYLRDKEKLTELALEWEGEWEGDITDTKRATEALSALQPHTNLLKLTICRYAGLNFPSWLGDSSFSKMVSFYLNGNEYCKFLPPLGQLPSLQELVIVGFHGVKKIGPEFYTADNSSISPFQSLEILKFSDMKRWKEWSFVGRDGEEDGCFPRLKGLHFDHCPNLAWSLPKCDAIESLEIFDSYKLMKSFPVYNFPKLKELKLKGCDSLEELILDSQTCIALQSLSIRDCKNLRSLPEHMHGLLPSLSEMSMCNCPEIEAFPNGGLPSNLNQLYIRGCLKLVAQSRHWNLQGLTSLRRLDIGSCGGMMLDSFPEGLLPSSLTSFALVDLPHLKSLNGSAFQNVTCLEELLLFSCDELQLLPQVLLPTSLRSFHIYHCPFLERRYQEGKGKDWHQISHIPDKCIRGQTTWELLESNEEEGSTSSDV